MGRKSEIDKIIEANLETFEKYDCFEAWAIKHLKLMPFPKKYRDAWDKCFKVTDEDDSDE